MTHSGTFLGMFPSANKSCDLSSDVHLPCQNWTVFQADLDWQLTLALSSNNTTFQIAVIDSPRFMINDSLPQLQKRIDTHATLIDNGDLIKD